MEIIVFRQLLLGLLCTALASTAMAASPGKVTLPEVAEGLPAETDQHGPLGKAVRLHLQAAKKRRSVAQGAPLTPLVARELYARATTNYRKHQRWRDGQLTDKVRFGYASALYFAGEYAAAVVQYLELSKKPAFEYRNEAYYGAARAHGRYVDRLARRKVLTLPPHPSATRRLHRGPMPQPVMAYAKSLDRFVVKAPKDKRAKLVAYKAGELRLRFGQLKAARTRLTAVWRRHCKHPIAGHALQALSRSHQLEGKRKQLLAWAKRLSRTRCGGVGNAKKLRKRGLDMQLRLRVEMASEKLAAARRLSHGKKKRRQLSRIAKTFTRALRAHPRPPLKLAATALFNAGLAYMHAHDYPKALTIFERVVAKYKKTRLAEYASHNIKAIRSAGH